MQPPGPDSDAIWKETFMGFFHECMTRFDPAFAKKIDRSRKVRFLDKELRALLGRSPRPRQHVDILAEVPLTGVGLDTMLTHVEVQRRKVAQFAQRILLYHASLIQRFQRPVLSLAILADPDPKWRPSGLTSGIDGSGTRFEFPICKLTDYSDAELELDPNPVNLVILAERVLRRHRKDPMALREGKLRLFGRMAVLLRSKRYSQEQRLVLTRAIDWSIPLPEDEEETFLEQLRQQEGDRPMTFLTTFERHALRKGLEQGRQDGVRLGWVEALKAVASVRFPDWKPSWNRILEAADDAELLQDWLKVAAASPSGAAFLKAIGKRVR
ncbi:MAG: hypothetical protein ACKPGI_03470 [Verrucomicrobiota bacterium]